MRTAAARLLGRDPQANAQDQQLLASVLDPHTPGDIQSAAVHALAMTGAELVPETLLSTGPVTSHKHARL